MNKRNMHVSRERRVCMDCGSNLELIAFDGVDYCFELPEVHDYGWFYFQCRNCFDARVNDYLLEFSGTGKNL